MEEDWSSAHHFRNFQDKRKYSACDLKCRYCIFTLWGRADGNVANHGVLCDHQFWWKKTQNRENKLWKEFQFCWIAYSASTVQLMLTHSKRRHFFFSKWSIISRRYKVTNHLNHRVTDTALVWASWDWYTGILCWFLTTHLEKCM